jgi:hypothetical protein
VSKIAGLYSVKLEVTMRFYVYELIDPRTDRVFYIGKGKDNRIDHHEREARRGKLSHKCNLIRQIEASGHQIGKRKVCHFEDEQQAYSFEAYLISKVGLQNLTNVTIGGGGSSTRRRVAISKFRGPRPMSDYQIVRNAVDIMKRTRGGQITHLSFGGVELDLLPIIESYVGKVYPIIAQRGLDWVNNIASRSNVRFAPDAC